MVMKATMTKTFCPSLLVAHSFNVLFFFGLAAAVTAIYFIPPDNESQGETSPWLRIYHYLLKILPESLVVYFDSKVFLSSVPLLCPVSHNVIQCFRTGSCCFHDSLYLIVSAGIEGKF